MNFWENNHHVLPDWLIRPIKSVHEIRRNKQGYNHFKMKDIFYHSATSLGASKTFLQRIKIEDN